MSSGPVILVKPVYSLNLVLKFYIVFGSNYKKDRIYITCLFKESLISKHLLVLNRNVKFQLGNLSESINVLL